jgi:serine phosphatase RsbU (regulator of sigma subunit)
MSIESLQQRIRRAESLLIALTIVLIAEVDYVVGPSISLGPLYLVPLCYTALTHSRRVTFAVFVLCLTLREVLGPLGQSPHPTFDFVRDLIIAAIFVGTAVYLGRLGGQRRAFFELAREQRDELEGEVRMAAQLQKRLLQLNQAPEGDLDIVAQTVQLRGVGGDYYDFVDLGERRTGIVMADIAGKGLQAALLMPAVRIALRSTIQRTTDPQAIVTELNRIIDRTTERQNYATLLLISIDLDTGEIEYVNAGHLPAMLVDGDGSVRWLGDGGPPVGLLPDAEYISGRATLDPGGNLVLYTDGVTESTNSDDAEFGLEALSALVSQLAGAPSREVVEAIRSRLLAFIGEGTVADDASVIAVRRRA